jgi:small subunit ribosomal protein S3Ae
MVKAKKKTLRVKKKHWFQIVSPKLFGEKVIGESYLAESTLMKGKKLKVNLKGLGEETSKQNLNIKFEIIDVKDNKAYCETIGYELLIASIKRLGSKGKEKLIESFVCKTKDNKNMRIKLVVVTARKVSNSVLTAIRKELKRIIEEKGKNTSFEEMIQETIRNKLQLMVKKALKKVYPLRICEVKSITIDDKRKPSFKMTETILDSTEVDETDNKTENKKLKSKTVKKTPKEEAKEVKEIENKKLKSKTVKKTPKEEAKEVKETGETEEVKEKGKKE